jgi:hypothetical protein
LQYEEYLRYEYGDNWRTPIQYLDFDFSSYKRKLYECKEKIKELLPDYIFYKLVSKSEKRIFARSYKKIQLYNSEHEEKLFFE